MRRVFHILLLTLICSPSAPASDLAREQRIREQIEDAILVGEPMTLRTGELGFLAIHTEAQTDETQGAVILLHGLGANPDWTEVIHPLRTRLPEHGWETLSLQMPVTAADAPRRDYLALIPEAATRIAFGVEFLKSRNIANIVVVGHSLGARMGIEWLAGEDVPKEITALVAVGLSADRQQRDGGTLAAIKKLQLPVLDIYGSRDLDTVLVSARARAAAARTAENPGYRQLEIEGADHFFRGLEDTLVMRVRAWLARVAAGMEKRL